MNIYEQWVFDKLEREKFAVFTPYKDRGVDCIVTHKEFGGAPQRIQIKGSRTYDEGVGWFQASAKALAQGTSLTDFWIFVWTKRGSRGRLEPIFLICPTADLSSRLRSYAHAPKGTYNIYLQYRTDAGSEIVVDTRGAPKKELWPRPANPRRDYSDYFQDWEPIKLAVAHNEA